MSTLLLYALGLVLLAAACFVQEASKADLCICDVVCVVAFLVIDRRVNFPIAGWVISSPFQRRSHAFRGELLII